MTPMLEIGELHVSYGQVDAVRGVSLSLQRGQIVSVIGPNGAGKTTLLAAAMGLLPSTGTLRFEGEDLAGLDVEARVERGICLVPERRELFGAMTVLDNLQLGAFSKRLGGGAMRQRLDAVYGRFPRLAERRTQRAETLSGGERQMLAVGRALMAAPRLLMLDEPSLGLAPLIVQEILAIVRELRQEGVSILLIEQNARAALDSSDHGYVLETGEIALAGPSHELANDPRVQATYLGSGVHDD
jgi:branched-chain amino acid transport system ATP-binding protein